MQLAIPSSELLLFEEQRIIHEGEGVEDVVFKALSEDESIIDESVQPGF